MGTKNLCSKGQLCVVKERPHSLEEVGRTKGQEPWQRARKMEEFICRGGVTF